MQLDELCQAALAGAYDDHHRDDIAFLIARLSRIAQDRHVSWNLAAKLTAARRARSLIRRPLRRWGLADLIPVTELVVSELVTNAVRYSQSKISLRLVLEGGLFCEVIDDSAALPRLRHPADDDERGRGLQVVSQIAQRWGARRTATGKVVWCEVAVPTPGTAASGGSAVQARGGHPPGPRAGSTGSSGTGGQVNSARPADAGDSAGYRAPANSRGPAEARGAANSRRPAAARGKANSQPRQAGQTGAHRRQADQIVRTDKA
jgi:anti-sigma regulatory factor (Ser/Thr protein kinase)